MASWIWRRGGSPEEIAEQYGTRPLTWRDRLLWERLGTWLGTAVLWIALVLWLLSGLYDVGPGTVFVVTCIGLFFGAAAMAEARFTQDLARWPRRTD